MQNVRTQLCITYHQVVGRGKRLDSTRLDAALTHSLIRSHFLPADLIWTEQQQPTRSRVHTHIILHGGG